MQEFINQFENVFAIVLQCLILVIEIISVCLLIYVLVKALISLFKKDDKIGLTFAKGLSLVLQFLMASELLATIYTHTLENVIILAIIIALRLAIGLFLIKEIHSVRKQEHSEKMDYWHAELTTAEEIKQYDKKLKDKLD